MAGPLEDDYGDGNDQVYPTEATRIRKGRRGCRLPNERAAKEPTLHKMLSGDVELKPKRKPKGDT